MTCDEQLERWVRGESIHNPTRDECCPDFSCCRPELQADQNTREAFKRANQAGRNAMLGMFLGGLLSGQPVHIAGDPANYKRPL
jgi:hypothetical protein